MAILITGVAGFIGSNLAKMLHAQGYKVFGIDNFCRGTAANLHQLTQSPRFQCVKGDLTNLEQCGALVQEMQSHDEITEVWHLAANSDIPAGVMDASVDLNDTFLSTFNILQIMKETGIDTMHFASSSAIYGNCGTQTLVEDFGPLMPISNYGAMKLASEAMISAAVESFLQRACIYRFPNVVGIPATHGVILDFIRKLKQTPDVLHVLGDGTQKKSYLHVRELIQAMLFIRQHTDQKRALYNIGPQDEGVTVQFIAEETVRQVAPSARIVYGGGDRGWVGDVPQFVYSTHQLRSLGWTPELSSHRTVELAISQIVAQELPS